MAVMVVQLFTVMATDICQQFSCMSKLEDIFIVMVAGLSDRSSRVRFLVGAFNVKHTPGSQLKPANQENALHSLS